MDKSTKLIKIYCCVCARQIVSYEADDDYIIGSRSVINMGPGKFCCLNCGKDLDENGLFPEERSFI